MTDSDLPPPLLHLVALGVTVLGLNVGSFLNVVAWRLPRGKSIVYPPSHCPRCGAPIRASDNVPVLAWLLLRGRCRVCRGPISPRYMLTEAATGALSLLFFLHDGLQPLLGFHLVYLYGLIALSLIDLDTFLLPLELTLPLIALGLAAGFFDPAHSWRLALLGAGIGWSLIVLIGFIGEKLLGKEAMGGGDSWLMASIGAFCGPMLMVVALFLASIQGSIIGFLMLRLRRPPPPGNPAPGPVDAPTPPGQDPQDAEGEGDADIDNWTPDPAAIPFGPFLSLGAIEALLWGEKLLHALKLDGILYLWE